MRSGVSAAVAAAVPPSPTTAAITSVTGKLDVRMGAHSGPEGAVMDRPFMGVCVCCARRLDVTACGTPPCHCRTPRRTVSDGHARKCQWLSACRVGGPGMPLAYRRAWTLCATTSAMRFAACVTHPASRWWPWARWPWASGPTPRSSASCTPCSCARCRSKRRTVSSACRRPGRASRRACTRRRTSSTWRRPPAPSRRWPSTTARASP